MDRLWKRGEYRLEIIAMGFEGEVWNGNSIDHKIDISLVTDQ